MIEIDGSSGEGGGQILRTSLSLSCVLGEPFKIFNIRAGRKKPGLMRQHLTCVRAAALISGAAIKGDAEGATELTFIPRKTLPGDYPFDIATAGSTSLVLQSLLPPLILAGDNSTLTIKGGTHVPFSPPFHYISEAFLPMLRRMGIEAKAEIKTYGFYPKGGGHVRLYIKPCPKVIGRDFLNRGNLIGINGISAVGNLPVSIAERQADSLKKSLGNFDADIEISDVSAFGQGTFIFIKAEFENATAGFSALGERGKRAEAVGEEAARECLEFLTSDACLDPHMADQIALYLALSKVGSTFTTLKITEHLKTNLHVIKRFMGTDYILEPPHRVTIRA